MELLWKTTETMYGLLCNYRGIKMLLKMSREGVCEGADELIDSS